MGRSQNQLVRAQRAHRKPWAYCNEDDCPEPQYIPGTISSHNTRYHSDRNQFLCQCCKKGFRDNKAFRRHLDTPTHKMKVEAATGKCLYYNVVGPIAQSLGLSIAEQDQVNEISGETPLGGSFADDMDVSLMDVNISDDQDEDIWEPYR